jgi:hypothetical protein
MRLLRLNAGAGISSWDSHAWFVMPPSVCFPARTISGGPCTTAALENGDSARTLENSLLSFCSAAVVRLEVVRGERCHRCVEVGKHGH